MILVFQKYHFNFTAGDAKLCWISIFTFSSRFLFILFLCFLGNFSQCILCSLPVTGAIFIRQKAKVSELLSGSNCCSLCHLTTVSMLQLPLYLLLTRLLSVLLALLVICTKYSRPGSKCGCTSRPSTSCYSPKSSSSPRLYSEFHVHIFSQIQWNFCCLRLKFKFYYARRIKWNEKWKTRSTKKKQKNKSAK